MNVLYILLVLIMLVPFYFQVSIVLLIFCPVYMQLFLSETVKSTPKQDPDSSSLGKIAKILHKRYKSMRNAATIVVSRYIGLISHVFITNALWP